MAVHRASHRALIRIALAALVVAGAFAAGHLAWSTATAVGSRSASIRTLGPSGGFFPGGALGGPRASGEGGNSQSGGLPEGGGEQGGGEQGGGGEAQPGSAADSGSSVSGSITSRVDPALVDIDTVLGIQGGGAAGTGMVVSSSGEVVTNNHVIAGATKITATDIGDGRAYGARVVGYDPAGDVAVLQLEGASGLKTVSLGEARSLQVGESIVTIGNAGGGGGTPAAASGQVAALDRSITASDDADGGQEHLSGLIELEGELQPGDSGGPLVNGAGEVLGMDTAASSNFRLQSSAHEGFAIPIEEVQRIAKQIVKGSRRSSTVHIGPTGLLGVLVDGGSSGEGARVEEVLPESPAAASGIAAGDLITAIDGASVTSAASVSEAILHRQPGEGVRVSWQTPAGGLQTATITLASGPSQ